MGKLKIDDGNQKVRVLMAKVGLDGHNRGLKMVSRYLMDSGMEVIYLGCFMTIEMIVRTAVVECIDVIGLNFMNGEQRHYVPKLLKAIRDSGLGDVFIVIGGVIPRRDIKWMKEQGINEVFPPATPIKEIIAYFNSIIKNVR